MTTLCMQDSGASAAIAPAACEIEWTDLVHVTSDDSNVYCLIKDQLKELELEEQLVSKPIQDLLNAYSQPNESILDVKKKTLETLKKEKLIPSLKPHASATPIAIYDAQWALAKERYNRQRLRYRRIEGDIHVIQNELRHGLLAPESRRFYSRYLASLQQTHAGLGRNLGNLEVLAKQKLQVLDSEKLRVKKLQAAVESEVEFRVAQQATPPESDNALKQLREKAQVLGEEAGLVDYVSSAELNDITEIEIKLIRCERHIESNDSQMLTRLGYKVVIQTDPTKALDLFQQSPNHFDLVITDMTMPHMNGIKLSEKLTKIRSDTPLLRPQFLD